MADEAVEAVKEVAAAAGEEAGRPAEIQRPQRQQSSH